MLSITDNVGCCEMLNSSIAIFWPAVLLISYHSKYWVSCLIVENRKHQYLNFTKMVGGMQTGRCPSTKDPHVRILFQFAVTLLAYVHQGTCAGFHTAHTSSSGNVRIKIVATKLHMYVSVHPLYQHKSNETLSSLLNLTIKFSICKN